MGIKIVRIAMYMYHFIIYGYTARMMAQLITHETQCVCARPAGYMVAVSQVQRQGIKSSKSSEIPLPFLLTSESMNSTRDIRKFHNKIGFYAN